MTKRSSKNMKPIHIILSGLGLLALSACDSKEEQRREKALERKADALEDAAEATREKGDKVSDAIKKDDPGLNAPSTNRAADAVKTDAERKADALEDAADATREKK
jgi:hypothetical protein